MKKLKRKHLQEFATKNQLLTEETQQTLDGKNTGTDINQHSSHEADDLGTDVTGRNANLSQNKAYSAINDTSSNTATSNYDGTSDYEDNPYEVYYGGSSYTGGSEYNEENLSSEGSITMSWKKFEDLKFPIGGFDQFLLRLVRSNLISEWFLGTIADRMNDHLNKFKLSLKGKADERYNITLVTKCYTSGFTHLYFILQAKYYDKVKKGWVTTGESKTDLFS